MTAAQEIIDFVKIQRGLRGNFDRIHLGLEYVAPKGACWTNSHVAEHFEGQHWRSIEAFGPYDAVYPGHSLAVIPTREPAGLVADFCDLETIIIGQVLDITSEEIVAATLEEITGYGGWVRQSILPLPSTLSPEL